MERESSLEERERKDREKAEAIQERRVRLGHVEAESKEEPSSGSEKEETTSKSKQAPRKKST